MVFHTQSNVVAWFKPGISQDIGQLNSSLMQLTVCSDLAGFGLDHSGEVGFGLGKYSWVHGHKLLNDTGHSRLGRKLCLA
jgi:hypothetical protein